MKTIEKLIAIAMLLFAIGFNLWLYRLEPTATIDPNDNAFQFALVDRTNQIWDFAQRKCAKNILTFPVCFSSYLVDHWVPNWAEGYNLPFYYSHVPQILIVGSWRFLVALSNFIRPPLALLQGVALQKASQQPLSLFQYYHWVIYLLLSLFPLSVFLALRVVKLPWLAVGVGALLASHISTDGLYGLDPPSFLWRGYGLSSQLFAMIWLPLAIAYNWKYLSSQSQLSVFRFQLSDIGRSVFSQSVTGKPKTDRLQTENRQQKTDNSFLPAVFFLTATAMGHLGLGMIAMLSLIPLACAPILYAFLTPDGVYATDGRLFYLHRIAKQQLVKLFLLTGAVIFFLSYWVVPIVLGDNYHNISFWDPPWKFGSYGAKETMVRLLNGDLFDWGRGPWMTVLVIVGVIGAAWPRNNDILKMESLETLDLESLRSRSLDRDIKSSSTRHQVLPSSTFGFSLLFIFWLLLYFGRTTWGPLVDLIPGMKEFHLSRFIVGVHAAGLFLAPIGAWWIVDGIWSQTPKRYLNYIKFITVITIIIIIGKTIFPQTISYAAHNDRLIRQANENRAKVKADEEALFAAIGGLPPGRVFAGRGGWWGKDFRVAETPYYMHLSTYGIPTVLWLPETWSPNSDVEQYFSEDQAKDYDLFGIRYVAAPPKQETQKFWKLIDERPTWKLYEIDLSSVFSSQLSDKSSPVNQLTGKQNTEKQETENRQQKTDNRAISYFTTGVRPAIVATDKRSYGNVVRLWIQSDAHEKGLYPELTFAKDYPKNTGLPNFKMLDEVTYRVPGGSTHNLFAEPPWYQNTTNTTNPQILPIIKSEENDSDMVFKARVSVPEGCSECIVVLKQSFHPNWRATIDGKPAPTFTVFPFFLATLVPSGPTARLDSAKRGGEAGTHEIVFSYEPSRLKVVLLVVELTTILVLIILRAKKRFG